MQRLTLNAVTLFIVGKDVEVKKIKEKHSNIISRLHN
jgi:hypothetical protein